jgi:hypothetical protein
MIKWYKNDIKVMKIIKRYKKWIQYYNWYKNIDMSKVINDI